MSTRITFEVADLFAGAGGMSEGAVEAITARGLTPRLVAVNHWPVAVATHTENHPTAEHRCAPVESVDPRELVPSGRLDLLMAAPECTHHANARGGKPINDQSRASAWHIMRWLELLRVESVLIENVPEFQTWGPLGANGRPLKSRKGEIFQAFIETLRRYGFKVEYRVLNAADYGAATSRRRLFIVGVRGNRRVPWPTPTHSKTGGKSLFGTTAKWRGAREIIDWKIEGSSIFNRKRPLAPATMRRILDGLARYSPALEPFLVILRQNMAAQSLDGPIPALTGNGTHVGLAEPFLIPFYGERDGQRPRTHSVDEPLPVAPASGGGKFGVIEPFVLQQQSGGVARRVDEPLPTVATDGAITLVQPFIVQSGGPRGGTQSVDEPMKTLLTREHKALVEPFLVPPRGFSEGAVDSVDRPLRTIKAVDGHVFGLVEPFITKYNGTAVRGMSVEEPLDTVTSRDRFGLVQPVINGYTLDIRFRMLQPHELSQAMSFPRSYVFTGNKGERIRQIGNAVDCRQSRALAGAIIDCLRPSAQVTTQERTA